MQAFSSTVRAADRRTSHTWHQDNQQALSANIWEHTAQYSLLHWGTAKLTRLLLWILAQINQCMLKVDVKSIPLCVIIFEFHIGNTLPSSCGLEPSARSGDSVATSWLPTLVWSTSVVLGGLLIILSWASQPCTRKSNTTCTTVCFPQMHNIQHVFPALPALWALLTWKVCDYRVKNTGCWWLTYETCFCFLLAGTATLYML